jgi:Ca-activated chloride channel family protein
VLDSSGSMMGPAWDGAQRAAHFALGQLRPGDYFNVVDFDSTATTLSPQSLPVDERNIQNARAFVTTRAADGGTEIAGALAAALALPPVPGHVRQLVFITDGAVGNEGEIYREIAARSSEARLFMVGIGHAPHRAFLRRSAELGRGFAEIIESSDAVDVPLQKLFRRLDAPVLTGIDVQWPSGSEAWPRHFPDLYAGEPLWLTGRVGPGGEVRIGARGATANFAKRMPIAAARPATGIGKIWAKRKIQALEDELDLGAGEAEVRDAVLKTALEHRLLSRYTSFVAVEKVVRRRDDQPLQNTKFDNPLPADAGGFAQTALGWQAWLLAGLAAMAMAAVLLLRSRA